MTAPKLLKKSSELRPTLDWKLKEKNNIMDEMIETHIATQRGLVFND
jgi:hypothetical protein